MKKLLALLLSTLLLLSFGVLAEEENWYLETAKELTAAIGELAKDNNYLDLMSGLHFDCLEALQTADFETILSAWHYEVPPVKGLIAIFGAIENASLSPTAMDYLDARMPGMVPSIYNGYFGAESVAASTVLTYSRSYVIPEGFEPCIITLELDKAAIAVSFAQTGEDSITVTACPLFSGEDMTPTQIVQDLGRVVPILPMQRLI